MALAARLSWACFWVEPAALCRLYLRRFRRSDDPCPALEARRSYCDARVFAGEVGQRTSAARVWEHDRYPEPAHDDPRWPARCDACGRPFGDGDHWQVMAEHLWRRPDTGQVWTMDGLPPGAMFDAFWRAERGDDGISLTVKTPPGAAGDLWCVDAPASSGGRWTRRGEPPHVTASPSILTPRYHGFLTDGDLTDSLPDRPLPG